MKTVDAGPGSLALFEGWLLTKGMARYTAMRYAGRVEKLLDWAGNDQVGDPAQLTYSDLLSYLEKLREQSPAGSTLVSVVNAINHYYTFLGTGHNPARHLKIKNVRRQRQHTLLTKEQLTALHKNYPTVNQWKGVNRLTALRRKLTVGLMVYQAMETGGLAKLTLQDIDLDKGTIRIPASGRQLKVRTLALEGHQVMEMYKYLEITRPRLVDHYQENPRLRENPHLLLVNGSKSYDDGQKVINQHLRKMEPAIGKAAGRQVRISVITHWLKQYNLREVQYMAGYRNVVSVEKLLKADITHLAADMETYWPL